MGREVEKASQVVVPQKQRQEVGLELPFTGYNEQSEPSGTEGMHWAWEPGGVSALPSPALPSLLVP